MPAWNVWFLSQYILVPYLRLDSQTVHIRISILTISYVNMTLTKSVIYLVFFCTFHIRHLGNEGLTQRNWLNSWEQYSSECSCIQAVHIFTYLLTPWSTVHLEKLTDFQLVKKFPSFYGTQRFITAFTIACHLSLSWASSIQSIPPHPTSWRSILILPSHLQYRMHIKIITDSVTPTSIPLSSNTLFSQIPSTAENLNKHLINKIQYVILT